MYSNQCSNVRPWKFSGVVFTCYLKVPVPHVHCTITEFDAERLNLAQWPIYGTGKFSEHWLPCHLGASVRLVCCKWSAIFKGVAVNLNNFGCLLETHKLAVQMDLLTGCWYYDQYTEVSHSAWQKEHPTRTQLLWWSQEASSPSLTKID